MVVKTHPNFDRSYKNRIFTHSKLRKHFEQRLNLFIQNPRNPILKDHSLKGGKTGYRSTEARD